MVNYWPLSKIRPTIRVVSRALTSSHTVVACGTRNSPHTRLCFSPGPHVPEQSASLANDPHSCARTLPGPTDRLLDLRSLIPVGHPTNRPTSIPGLTSSVQGFGANPRSWTLRDDGTCDSMAPVKYIALPRYTRPSYSSPFCSPLRETKPVIPPFFETCS